MTVREAYDEIRDHGFSRIPIFADDDEENIIGFLNVKDLIKAFVENNQEKELKCLVRPIMFVPFKKKTIDLMLDFQKGRGHIAMVVDEAGLYEVALSLELGDYLLLGKGEDQSLGREKPSILADTTEALIGAVYLDAGFVKTMKIITRLFLPLLKRVGTEELVHDFKTLLQEYTQKTCKALPKYSLLEVS